MLFSLELLILILTGNRLSSAYNTYDNSKTIHYNTVDCLETNDAVSEWTLRNSKTRRFVFEESSCDKVKN